MDTSLALSDPTPLANFYCKHANLSNTEELAYALSTAIEERFGKGKKPYIVLSRAHRKFLDPNRPAELAYEDPDAKPVYDDYHRTLAEYCRDIQKQFRQGLLLDLHGQGTARKGPPFVSNQWKAEFHIPISLQNRFRIWQNDGDRMMWIRRALP